MKKIMFFFVLLFASIESMACSCAFDDSNFESQVKSSYESASSVVLAKVQSIEKLDPYEYRFGKDDKNSTTEFLRHRTHFSEIKSWKGKHGKQFYTNIMVQCCVCGYEFEMGKTYLLYLYGPDEEGFYATSICSRTSLYSDDSGAEIEVLNRLQKPN